MRVSLRTLAVLTAAASLLATPVAAGELVGAYAVFNPLDATPDRGISFKSNQLEDVDAFATPRRASSLAYGADSIYAAVNLPNSTAIERYNLNGDLLAARVTTLPGYTGPLAFGNDTLFVAWDQNLVSPASYGVFSYGPAINNQTSFNVPGRINGLAFGADSLFITYAGTLARYDLAGNLLGKIESEFGHAFGALAFGADTLFMAYETAGGTYGVGYYLPSLAFEGGFFESEREIEGLAFGGDALFTSDSLGLGKYDLDGHQLDYKLTPLIEYGALAYAPLDRHVSDRDRRDPRNPRNPRDIRAAVPEPATWAILILGFGGVGTVIRARRRRGLGLA